MTLIDDTRIIIYDHNRFIIKTKVTNATLLTLMARLNKLECLSLVSSFMEVLYLRVRLDPTRVGNLIELNFMGGFLLDHNETL